MREETVNGVRREIYDYPYQRTARLYADSVFDSATVLQPTDIDNLLIWGAVRVTASSHHASTVDALNLHIEALRQAVEIMRQWQRDVGKPIAASGVQ